MKKSLALLLLLFAISSSAQTDIRAIYGEAMEAYTAKDYTTFLRLFQKLDSLSPMHPTITFNLGAAYARNGDGKMALSIAKKVVRMNTSLSPQTDEDYMTIFSSADSLAIIELKEEQNLPVSNGTVTFTNSEIDLHPESVAFDSKSGHFFLNSVRKGKILRYDPTKKQYTEFASGRWAIMGMKVFKDQLWACEVATNEYENFKEEDAGKTALLQYDLKSGKLLNRYEQEGGHWFGDLVFSKSGKVYISDSRQPIIYTLNDDQLAVFKDLTNVLFNLQGLSFSADESLLYIADYKIGLQVLNMKTMKVAPITNSKEVMTKGTDGLYFYNNSLICIQNGVSPFRVTQYFLDDNGTAITGLRHLDKARIELHEPTLGVLVGDALYYIANSPWGAYKEGSFVTEGLKDIVVMKVVVGE